MSLQTDLTKSFEAPSFHQWSTAASNSWQLMIFGAAICEHTMQICSKSEKKILISYE